VVAMASGFAGNDTIRDADSVDARVLQAALTALLQGLAKTIAWDGEGATVCIEVCAPRPSMREMPSHGDVAWDRPSWSMHVFSEVLAVVESGVGCSAR